MLQTNQQETAAPPQHTLQLQLPSSPPGPRTMVTHGLPPLSPKPSRAAITPPLDHPTIPVLCPLSGSCLSSRTCAVQRKQSFPSPIVYKNTLGSSIGGHFPTAIHPSCWWFVKTCSRTWSFFWLICNNSINPFISEARGGKTRNRALI